MKCQICGKTSVVRNNTKKLRGHINPTTKTWKKANIQWVKVDGKRIRACTRCIKTLAKKGKV